MEETFVRKMIEQSFVQYHLEQDWLTDRHNFKKLYSEVIRRYSQYEGELYELIEDVVYEFVTT